jgi:lipopolysaccharide/colanic/teichoic acid biosynthesis glycosyltransferase
MTGPYRGKRLVDLTALLVLAVPAAAIALVSALAVRLTSWGPVFFKQERVGRDGVPFTIIKFRTMLHRVDRVEAFPDPADITRVGRVLRRFSLDELPQLFNVLRGDMSAVGPRPTLAYQADRHDARQRGRVAVRPGLTGLAQIRGRNSLSWAERIELDLEYIAAQSVWFDVRLLLSTPAVLLRGTNVDGHPTDDPIAVSNQA